MEDCYKVSLKSSHLQTEEPQISHPGLTEEVLQSFIILTVLLYTHSSRLMCFLCWAPELDAALQVASHQSRATESLPQPAVHGPLDAGYTELPGLGGHMASLCLVFHPPGHSSPFPRVSLSPFIAQLMLTFGIVPTQVQEPTHGPVEHEVFPGLPLNPVQVPLNDIPSL